MKRRLRLFWIRRLLARSYRLERQADRRIRALREVSRMIDGHLTALAREDFR